MGDGARISGKIEGLNQTLQITHRFMPDAENTETRGNIQNIPFSHKKYMLLAKYHTKKLFTTETKTNGYHTLHYHHSNFTTILPSVSLFLPFSVTEIRFRDPKGKSMP